jgi:hypothetical protein
LCTSLRERAPESLIDIAVDNLARFDLVVPSDLERRVRFVRRSILERVHEIVIVLDLDVRDLQLRCADGRLHVVDAVVIDPRDPKEAVLEDARIEVVDLRVGANRPREKVQSYQTKGPVTPPAVFGHIGALHETQVDFEVER